MELVTLKGEHATCSSRDVASHFGKRHDKLLFEIERKYHGLIGKGCAQNGGDPFFMKSTYVEKQNGQEYPHYLINRDGFALLVMGFTGKEALSWKLKYIEAFNAMEKLILEKQTASWEQVRLQGVLARKSETDTIKALVEYAKTQGSQNSDRLYVLYTKLANDTVGITKRNLATFAQLSMLSIIENVILNVIRAGMANELHYKVIYQNCKTQLRNVVATAFLST